jgi:hypothetical protein
MKTLLLALLLAAALTPASAAEQQKRVLVGYRHHMPPAEYDVPYEGTLTIWWVSTAQQIREFCPNAEFGPAGFAMACAKRSKGDPPHKTCDVYVVKNPSYNGFKFNLEARLRHELAHCNGWGAERRSTSPSPR